jgi:hypothetical protein
MDTQTGIGKSNGKETKKKTIQKMVLKGGILMTFGATNEIYKRQTGIFNPAEHDRTVSIIGCGSVGSFTALALAKMGVRLIELFDSDTVEEHNIPNQFFKLSQIGSNKVDAVYYNLLEFDGIASPSRSVLNISDNTLINGNIAVSAVDSMESRKTIWTSLKNSLSSHYIDSRMGGNIFSLYTVDLRDAKQVRRYEKTLLKDEDALQVRCTERTIIYNVLGLASMICRQVVNIMNGNNCPFEIHFDYSGYDIAKVD